MKKYQIIYADPPWSFNFQKRSGLSNDAKNSLYPTMKADDIVKLPIKKLADNNAILFLWVMNSELPLALRCIDAWGFDYKTVAFTWVKTTKNTYHFGGGIGQGQTQNYVCWQSEDRFHARVLR